MQEPDTIKVDPAERPPGLPGGGERGAGAGRRVLVAIIMLALAAGAWWLWSGSGPAPAPGPATSPEPLPEVPAAEAAGPTFPIESVPEAETVEPLPALDDSDGALGRAVAELIGATAFRQLVIPDGLARRFVATIDNLPRRQAPRSKWPIREASGAFVVGGTEEAPVLEAANFARYDAYVRVATLLDAGAAVAVYRRFYPLFQQAYEDLGYPDRYFNDRLVQTIDDLLAAPEIEAPIALVRPEVLYEFADPALESRSAGQKVLVRMGPANAQRIKAKLREIRALLVGG
jgi:hypothetical protein